MGISLLFVSSASVVMVVPSEHSFSLRFSRVGVALREAPAGRSLSSRPFECGGALWSVLLYPRGTDRRREGSVAAFLQLLGPGTEGRGPTATASQTSPPLEVDASFSISLGAPALPSGRASESWDWTMSECATGGVFRCGMTFAPRTETAESVGRAQDWGAHLANSARLAHAGVDEIDVELTIRIWRVSECRRGAALAAVLAQAAAPASWRRPLRLGEVLVPLPPAVGEPPLPEGVYPGVEYRIIAIRGADSQPAFQLDYESDAWTSESGPADGPQAAVSSSSADAEVLLRPTASARDLADWQRRPWPVAVRRRALPRLASRFDIWRATPARLGQLVRADAAGLALALLLGVSPLLLGGFASMFGSLYLIPSRSMEPTLLAGDLVLARKRGFSPLVSSRCLAKGQLVLFTPPPELRQRVEAAGGRLGERDMFVKRVAATAGDEVSVDEAGGVTVNGVPVGFMHGGWAGDSHAATVPAARVVLDAAGSASAGRAPVECDASNEVVRKGLLASGTVRVPAGRIFVLGDCSGASVDSRVWGPLDETNVIGTPSIRLWPASRFGGVM